MDKMLRRVFYLEVERQTKFSLIAAEDIQLADDSDDLDRLWYSIQSFLIATANVSKLLWPNKTSISDRGTILRN